MENLIRLLERLKARGVNLSTQKIAGIRHEGVLHATNGCLQEGGEGYFLTSLDWCQRNPEKLCRRCFLNTSIGWSSVDREIGPLGQALRGLERNTPAVDLTWYKERMELLEKFEALQSRDILVYWARATYNLLKEETIAFLKENQAAFRELHQWKTLETRRREEANGYRFEQLQADPRRILVAHGVNDRLYWDYKENFLVAQIYPRYGRLYQLPMVYDHIFTEGLVIKEALDGTTLKTIQVLLDEGGIYEDLQTAYEAAVEV